MNIDKEAILARFQVKKPHTPRTPREEQLDRASKLLNWSVGKVLGKTRHFTSKTDKEAYTRRLRALNDEAEHGNNPPALWQYLLKTKYAKS